MRNGREPDGGGDLADEPGEQASGQRGMVLGGSFRVYGVDAVEPEDGVEVDKTAPLIFGDFGVYLRTGAGGVGPAGKSVSQRAAGSAR